MKDIRRVGQTASWGVQPDRVHHAPRLITSEACLSATFATIVIRVLIFIAIIVLMSAVSIWLGTGPVVLSP